MAALLAEIECLQLKRGDVLIREGEDADRLFVVIYGRLRIVAQDADGKETVVDEIGRGDTLGERSLLAGDARSVTVYALRESAVGVITRPLFENLKLQYPEVIHAWPGSRCAACSAAPPRPMPSTPPMP